MPTYEPTYDPFGIDNNGVDIPAADVPLGDDHAGQLEKALYRSGAGLIEVTTTVDSPAGVVTTTKQLPPNVDAAKTLLAVLKPDRYRDDRPLLAVQYVINAPSPAKDGATWLASVRDRLALPTGQAVPDQDGQSEGVPIP